MTSYKDLDIESKYTTSHSCYSCKSYLEANSDIITCSECSKSYHISCSKLSNIKAQKIKNSPNLNFKCYYCKEKNKCAKCSNYLRNDPSTCVYCFSCEVLSCYTCANIRVEEIKKFNTSPELYHCVECSTDYFCAVCKSLCKDGCIMCDICKSWVHFKCSKLTTKQLRRYSKTEDKYY